MAHVRETIKLLSIILSENGATEIQAEVFRQAKFDKSEAAPALWKLLFQLNYFCKFGTIDEIAIKLDSELSQEEKCVYVKQELQQLGYLLPDFASLSSFGDSGSRELLLALGWLICKENVMERFMDNCTSPVEDHARIMYEEKLKGMKKSPPQPLSESKDMNCKIHQLLMLNGKLQLNLRRLYTLQMQEANLSHKVHEATQGVSMMSFRNHLSPAEVKLLRYPAQLKKMLFLLEKDNERLQNLLLWKDQEHIFWKWMESVLELKISEGEIQSASTPRDIPVYLNIPADCNKKIASTRQQLVDTILQYEDIIDQLESLWARKHEDICEQDLDNLLTSINMEIALQRANLTLNTTENILKNHKEPQFILEEPAKKRAVRPSKHLSLALLHGKGDGQGVDINSAVRDIEKHIEDIEHELMRDQGICTKEMDKIFPGASPLVWTRRK